LHFYEPKIDYVVAGDVPEIVIAILSSHVVPERGVQQFVSDYEAELLLIEAGGGI
jgi:hypothetical protein